MKIALPVWNGRISPVFDVARMLTVIDMDHGVEVRRSTQELAEAHTVQRCEALVRWGINVLICGAITESLLANLEANGVRVVSQTHGDIDEVLQAFLAGRLTQSDLLFPNHAQQERQP